MRAMYYLDGSLTARPAVRQRVQGMAGLLPDRLAAETQGVGRMRKLPEGTGHEAPVTPTVDPCRRRQYPIKEHT
jgi:hypothetical protein